MSAWEMLGWMFLWIGGLLALIALVRHRAEERGRRLASLRSFTHMVETSRAQQSEMMQQAIREARRGSLL